MAIKIGEATSWKEPEDLQITVDDRQQIIETDGGNVVQDYGHVASGDKITFSCVFERDEFIKVYHYWQNRELVDFTDISGIVWKSCRVKIMSYSYTKNFTAYINTTIEIWRI